jgi:hypothetical protein
MSLRVKTKSLAPIVQWNLHVCVLNFSVFETIKIIFLENQS